MKKTKIIKIIPVLAWLVVGIGCLVAWMYLYAVINKKVVNINNLKIQAKNAELSLEQKRDLENLADEIIIKKQKIDALFLNKNTLINFIEKIEEVGKTTGVVLKINSSEVKTNPVFKLSVEGNYSQVFKFLLLLENFPYKIIINNLVMQEQGASVNGGAFWKADIDLTLLSYEDKI